LIDSVARFHLGNGARLGGFDWLGDLSLKGLRESRHHGQLSLSSRGYREDHGSLRNQGEIAASSACEETAETEGRRAAGYGLS